MTKQFGILFLDMVYITYRSMYDKQRGLRSVLLDIIFEHKSL